MLRPPPRHAMRDLSGLVSALWWLLLVAILTGPWRGISRLP